MDGIRVPKLKDPARVNLYLPAEIREKLCSIAEDELSTMSRVVCVLVRREWMRRSKEAGVGR